MKHKIIRFDQLSKLHGKPIHQSIHKIVLCHGVFDVIHAGHLKYFESAKAFGDILVVSLTTDGYVNKGPGRPYFTAQTRAEMIAALEIVNFVCISDFPTAVPVIHELKPDFYVKGPDYRDKSKDLTGEIYNEEAAVHAGGGEIVFTSDETHSSSKIINRHFEIWNDEQKQTIERVKDLGGEARIEYFLEEISKLKVLIVGEPIIDVYRFVEPQNISSKSPSISARFLYEERYNGGALAIRNHLESFVKHVDYLFGQPENQWPIKTRFISSQNGQRMFEETSISDTYENGIEFVSEVNDKNRQADATILADFGHGLFEGRMMVLCGILQGFIALNVQTNSSNYGFNPFTKHERFSYLSIDLREARVAFHDNKSSADALVSKIKDRIGAREFSLTLGSAGARFGDVKCPAFVDSIVDATGAGDAYFAITSALVKVGTDRELIPFIGNVFAGLKTKIIGNKASVTKPMLMKAIRGILK